jgi:hypothetical protein
MILTEEQAKTKWCPHVRQAVEHEEGLRVADRELTMTNVDHTPNTITANCIGSACMQWRWAQKRNPDFVPKNYMVATLPTHPADHVSPFIEDTSRGYCGLAGKP